MAYDLAHELGISLRGVVANLCGDTATTSPWWLITLIEQLPDNGALAASFQGGRQYRGWGVDRHLAADMWDLKLAELSDPKKGKPATYPRPGAKPKGRSLGSLRPPRRREG